MTKALRIENADLSQHKVIVRTMQKSPEGQADVVVEEFDLSQPTQITTKTIHSGQYLVIVEADE